MRKCCVVVMKIRLVKLAFPSEIFLLDFQDSCVARWGRSVLAEESVF